MRVLVRNQPSCNNSNIYIATVIIVIPVLMTLGIMFHSPISAQTLQEKCTPDSGINVSKSNCFSNSRTHPTFNVSNTNTFAPPRE